MWILGIYVCFSVACVGWLLWMVSSNRVPINEFECYACQEQSSFLISVGKPDEKKALCPICYLRRKAGNGIITTTARLQGELQGGIAI